MRQTLIMISQDYQQGRQGLIYENEVYIRRTECLSEQGIWPIPEQPNAEAVLVGREIQAWIVTRHILKITDVLRDHNTDPDLPIPIPKAVSPVNCALIARLLLISILDLLRTLNVI